MSDTVIKFENLYKQYRLGTIGTGTFYGDVQSWLARVRGKEDPNSKIGETVNTKSGKFYALNNINAEVHAGDALGIIGRNGAGKSTLLKVLSRVTAPTKGTVSVKGRISSMLEVGTGFHPELTGRENIFLNGAILGMRKSEIAKKLDEIIEFSEIEKFIDTPVKRYSSGMYVKLAFSVAAHLDSEILVMDEVLAVGDMKFQQKCLGKMDSAANNEGRAVLYVSHNMSTIRNLCSRCIVLDHGSIIFDGGTEDAISLYMERGESDLKAHYDFRDLQRIDMVYGQRLYVKDLYFLDKTSANYYQNEKIRFKVCWDLFKDVGKLQAFATLRYADDVNVCTAISDNIEYDPTKKEHETVFEFDSTGLMPGRYYFHFSIFSTNEFGSYLKHDHVTRNIFFEISVPEGSSALYWPEHYFGHIRMPDMKVLDNSPNN
ncbi:MAG: ABC transporter ATP-binding protein [Clostridiales bacterium]|nr:ABC transporter ATP-binding protein [Clostridiales bacterium]